MRRSKLLALLTMSFLIVLLVPAVAFAAPQAGLTAGQSELTAQLALDTPVIDTIKATANDNGTFNVDIKQSGTDQILLPSFWLNNEELPFDAYYDEQGSSPSSGYVKFKGIPGTYANMEVTYRTQFIAGTGSLRTDSRIAQKSFTFPAAVTKKTEDDVKALDNGKGKRTNVKYGGDLKKGTKSTIKTDLYTLTIQVKDIAKGDYIIEAKLVNAPIIEEVYGDVSYKRLYLNYTNGPKLNDGKHEFEEVGSYGYALLKREKSDDGMVNTMTMTIDKEACNPGWNNLAITVEPYGGKNIAVAAKTYNFEFTQQLEPPSPDTLHGTSAKATKNSLAIGIANSVGTVKVQYRKKGAKKWTTKTIKKDTITLKKLKASTAYQIRMQSSIKSKNLAGKSTKFTSKWSPVYTLKTAPSARPAIKSITHGAVSKSRYWQSGYWTSYTSSGRWIPGRYVTSTSTTVTIKLAKKVKGAVGYEVKFGSNIITGKLGKDGRTIKFVCGASSTKSFKVRVFTNNGYENQLAGFSKWSASKKLYF